MVSLPSAAAAAAVARDRTRTAAAAAAVRLNLGIVTDVVVCFRFEVGGGSDSALEQASFGLGT